MNRKQNKTYLNTPKNGEKNKENSKECDTTNLNSWCWSHSSVLECSRSICNRTMKLAKYFETRAHNTMMEIRSSKVSLEAKIMFIHSSVQG